LTPDDLAVLTKFFTDAHALTPVSGKLSCKCSTIGHLRVTFAQPNYQGYYRFCVNEKLVRLTQQNHLNTNSAIRLNSFFQNPIPATIVN